MFIASRVNNTHVPSFIDSGASGHAFVTKAFAQRLALPISPLTIPVPLAGFEGPQIDDLTEFTSLELEINGHKETLVAYVLKTSKHELMLGLPWLEKHNPYINWKDHTLTFGGSCLDCCCLFETTVPYFNSTDLVPATDPVDPFQPPTCTPAAASTSAKPQPARHTPTLLPSSPLIPLLWPLVLKAPNPFPSA